MSSVLVGEPPAPALDSGVGSASPSRSGEELRARVEQARRREREAMERLQDAIRRCHEVEAAAARRLAALDALIQTTRAMLHQNRYLGEPRTGTR